MNALKIRCGRTRFPLGPHRKNDIFTDEVLMKQLDFMTKFSRLIQLSEMGDPLEKMEQRLIGSFFVQYWIAHFVKNLMEKGASVL
jgi:hypothetical protein